MGARCWVGGKDVFGAIIMAGKENGEVFLADDENFVTSLTNSLGMVLKHVKQYLGGKSKMTQILQL